MRLRITIFFAALVFLILVVVSVGIYYFSYTNRTNIIQTRLSNRAITTGRLLSQFDIFNQAMVQKIDSSTAISIRNKVVQVYDESGKIVYAFSDIPGDRIEIDNRILEKARSEENVYFTEGDRDAVAFHYKTSNADIVVIAAAYDFDGNSTLANLRVILGFCLIGGVFIAIGAGYLFSSGLMQPVKKIADEVNEISAQSLARRLPTPGTKDEWNYLAGTLNDLLNRLQDSFETQGRFVANASHELSTPLTSISSQLEVSLQRHRDAADYRRVMTSVYQDVRHLSRLTQTLLEFAKAAGTAGGLEIESLRIDEIILRMPGDVVKADAGFHVRLYFDDLPGEEDQLLVLGNEDLLHTAIRNIVVNACKYSPNHEAKIKLTVTDGQVLVSVTNTGKSIPKEELEKIFQPFYRSTEDTDVKGFGLGLSLAMRIIKLHHGDISVKSDTAGTAFTITLPSAK